ncbi:glycosyltransferase family 2 protein [Hamadaea sp. NPDC051192]|uniref:glycosyltransferase family 2 protein n=1 Tax=Hamadaea sp. NPDC051192 TaxID=3154940 RepID=UPI00342832B5
MSVSVVIPCYRSEKTLPALVERLHPVLAQQPGDYEIILVVDGSPDNTWQVAADLAQLHERTRAIRLARNYGQHNAIVAGVRAARFDVIVTMDDDLQHPPEEIPRLLTALEDDVDLVYGVSVEEEHKVGRNIGSRGLKAALTLGLGVPDARNLSAFRAFRSFLRGGFDLITGPHLSIDVALSWTTTRIVGVAVRMEHRQEGESGYTLRTLIARAVDIAVGYSVRPLRIVTYVGFLVGLAGLVLVGRLLWLYFTGNTTVAGFTTIATVVAIFASVQMIAIGVLGEYVGRIHSHGMGRPTYVIRDRVSLAATPAQREAEQQTVVR